jgi:hypothetical protein
MSQPYRTGGKISYRAWFSPDEYKEPYQATRDRVENSKKSMPGAVLPFQRALKRRNPKPTDIVFPKTHHDLFNTILGELGLKADREGQRRTFYSPRHTYICMRLMEGADVYQIAKNCRTSVKMIEDLYASHIKNMVDASVINVRRPKAPAARTRKPKRRPNGR